MYRDVGAGLKPAPALPWNANAISSPYPALHKAIAITPKPYGPMYRDVGAGLKPALALPWNANAISSPYPALHKAIAITPKPYGPMYRDVGAGLKPALAMGTQPPSSSRLCGLTGPRSFQPTPERRTEDAFTQ